jgi:hypothetical protein
MRATRTYQLPNQAGIKYREYNSYFDDISYYWTLNINHKKSNTVKYKIIPDGCIDIVFELRDDILYNPNVSAPFTNLTEISLPINSSFLGIRFKPGKFRKYIDIDPSDIKNEFSAFGRREYKNINDFLNSTNQKRNPLSKFGNNLTNLLKSSLSQRQKRRIFKASTGFSIRDFNKIQKFQNSIGSPDSNQYFDQPHMIKAYKDLTGLTPLELQKFL